MNQEVHLELGWREEVARGLFFLSCQYKGMMDCNNNP